MSRRSQPELNIVVLTTSLLSKSSWQVSAIYIKTLCVGHRIVFRLIPTDIDVHPFFHYSRRGILSQAQSYPGENRVKTRQLVQRQLPFVSP